MERAPMMRRVGVVAVIVALTGAVVAVRAGRVHAEGVQARALLRSAAGEPVGQVTLSEDDGIVLVRAVVHDLAPGFHGFHIHSAASCVAPGFTSAGGHFNPTAATHRDHAGDLPSLLVMADGTGELRFKTDRFGIADLLAGSGTAFIVHANADNYANIPLGGAADQYTANSPDATAATGRTGNAGARIACGVVQ